MTYTVSVVLGLVGSAGLDLGILQTRLLLRRGFWASYAIVLFFQLVVNGLLTGLNIVRYRQSGTLGVRVAFAPIEDLFFGFAMVLTTLTVWVWLGRRVARDRPHADHLRPRQLDVPPKHGRGR